MSNPDRDFQPEPCRVCGCLEESPCVGGCCRVPDPGQGELCSACLVLIHDAVGRLLMGRADQADRQILACFAQVDLPDDEPPPARVLVLPDRGILLAAAA